MQFAYQSDGSLIVYSDFMGDPLEPNELERARLSVLSTQGLETQELSETLIRVEEDDDQEDDQVDLLPHPRGLLLLVSKRIEDESGNMPVPRLSHLLWFEQGCQAEPQVIRVTNQLEPLDESKDDNIMYNRKIELQVSSFGLSDDDQLPVVVNWSECEIFLTHLQIDFEQGTAAFAATNYKDFDSVKRSDLRNFREIPTSVEWEQADKTLAYYKRIHSLSRMDQRVLVYTKGNCWSSSIMRYGMQRFVFLGEMTPQDDGRYRLSRVSREVYFDSEEAERGFLFRELAFTTDRKYGLIRGSINTQDPWYHQDILVDLETEALHHLEFPRGFKKHQVVDVNGRWYFSRGESSKGEDLITVFEADDAAG